MKSKQKYIDFIVLVFILIYMQYTWNYIPGNKCTKYNVFALHNIFYINQYKILTRCNI